MVRLADDQWLYFVTLAVAPSMFLLAAELVRGRVGTGAGRDPRERDRRQDDGRRPRPLQDRRVRGQRRRTPGVGGALFTLPIGFLAPESFPLALSFAFLAAIVVGGLATIAGALFGALFIEFVPVYASDVDEALAGVIYGGVLILFMYLLPGRGHGARRGQIGRRAAARGPRRRCRRNKGGDW